MRPIDLINRAYEVHIVRPKQVSNILLLQGVYVLFKQGQGGTIGPYYVIVLVQSEHPIGHALANAHEVVVQRDGPFVQLGIFEGNRNLGREDLEQIFVLLPEYPPLLVHRLCHPDDLALAPHRGTEHTARLKASGPVKSRVEARISIGISDV